MTDYRKPRDINELPLIIGLSLTIF